MVTVNEDGRYTFTAIRGEKTVSADIIVNAFSKLNSDPSVEIIVEEEKVINVTAIPVFGTSIKTIVISKDGVSLKKVTTDHRSAMKYLNQELML